jgi:hypothetical protein
MASHDSSDISDRTLQDRRIFAWLGEIQAAASRWQGELAEASKSAPSDAVAAIDEQILRMPQIDAVIKGNLGNIRSSFQKDDEESVKEHEWGASILINLDLIWKDIGNTWPPDRTKPEQGLRILSGCADPLDEMIYICTSTLLTPEINDVLSNLDVGQPLDVNFKFGDTFPRNAERQHRLLLEVAQERAVIANGIVDYDHGVIYRVDPPSKRWKSYFKPPVLLLALFVFIALLPWVGGFVDSWPLKPEMRMPLIAGYAMWTIGAFLHVLIGALRQQRSPTAPAFAVMDNWPLWVHIKERAILYGIVWITLGYIILIFLKQDLDFRVALLAGYSADSLTELFVERFEGLSSVAVKAITEQTAPKPAATASSSPASKAAGQ